MSSIDQVGATAKPVATIDEITAEWLSLALGQHVSEVSAERVGTGQMGECYRLTVSGSPDLPTTILAKLPASDPATRDFLHGSYRIEVVFYRDLLGTLSVSTPKPYFADISEDPERRGTFTLLLEDLAPASQGDQIAGCSPEDALRAVENLAGLHAPRWNDVTLQDIEGLSLPTRDDAEMMDSLFADATEQTLGMLGDLVRERDASTMRSVAPYAGRWIVGDPERFSLVHGDYRLDNLMFHPDGRVWALDWQTLALGLPMRDVAFMISSGLEVEDRREHEQGLVAAYHRRLTELGVTGYSFESCWSDYSLGLLQTPLIAVFGCAYSSTRTDRGDRMFAAMISRGCQAIRDHQTLRLLEAL